MFKSELLEFRPRIRPIEFDLTEISSKFVCSYQKIPVPVNAFDITTHIIQVNPSWRCR